MAYKATVIPVMIASPGDVLNYRVAARDVIHEWNYIHSIEKSIVLEPVAWETHSSPELGASAQELINDRVLADCDLLIGIFWTRLGTPTKEARSGTVEEIQRHVDAGKPAMVYFSTEPVVMDTVDLEQVAAVKEFRKWCEPKGIVETIDNVVDFRSKLSSQLRITFNKSNYLRDIFRNTTTGVIDFTNEPNQSSTSDPLVSLALGLNEEAKTLLMEAASDDNGLILKHETFGGKFIQTNGKTLGEPADRRSSARWEYALEQLLSADLVRPKGIKNQVFEISDLGYRLADYFSNENGGAE